MKRTLHRFALRVFGLIPWRIQRFLIGLVKPAYVAGASAVVTDGAGRILLVRHSYKKGWSTPGGFLNRHEVADVAVVREVFEELGVRVEPCGDPVVVLRGDDRIVEFVQRVRLVDEADAPSARPKSAEIDEVAWFDRNALPHLSSVTRRALAELAEAESRRS